LKGKGNVCQQVLGRRSAFCARSPLRWPWPHRQGAGRGMDRHRRLAMVEHGVYWIERSNQADAEAAALAACRQSGTSRGDCRIMASGPTCAAVSADPDGLQWHGGSGSTRPAAEAAALAPPAERGAHIVASHCNGDLALDFHARKGVAGCVSARSGCQQPSVRPARVSTASADFHDLPRSPRQCVRGDRIATRAAFARSRPGRRARQAGGCCGAADGTRSN
jgi:hypothetical protein